MAMKDLYTEKWTATCKSMKLDYWHHTRKLTLTDLNVRPKTIKLLKENIDSKFLDISLGDDYLDLIPKPKATKAKINK